MWETKPSILLITLTINSLNISFKGRDTQIG